MSNIFVLPFWFSFAPSGRANARRPLPSGPLVGLLSLSFCLLVCPGGQALADDRLQSRQGVGESRYHPVVIFTIRPIRPSR